MYTIKHAAQQVGISTATLRAWERRYGVIAPHRSE
ncbi:MAG: MerR family DNA-binding transcriptional regulator, partial [Pseudonocardiaceae bacterium]